MRAEFRRLTPLDAAPCERICAECLEGAGAWSAEAFRDLPAIGGIGVLAVVDGEPAGLAVGRAAAGEGEILCLCVRPAYRGRGIGRGLMERLVDALPGGPDEIFLEVETTRAPAEGLYRSLGFSPCGLRKDYYGRGRDARLMRRVRGVRGN